MRELIKNIARESGATNEAGGRACNVFCFTESELLGFAVKIAELCERTVNATQPGYRDYRSQIEEAMRNDCAWAISDRFKEVK